MINKKWTIDLSVAWLKRATVFGVLGTYSHVEITEVVGYRDDDPKAPINVFSIAVLETRQDESPTKPTFLNGKDRIRLTSLDGWTFGIVRYLIDLASFAPAYEKFASQSIWNLGEVPIRLGEMVPIAPQFVPPNQSEPIPLNRVLKNNFWNGSYVVELFDNTKRDLKVFLEEPHRLQELSDRVQKHVPLQLAGLSDRLGNIIAQLPCTVLRGEFRVADEGFSVEVAWHPQVRPRPLRAVTSMEFDGIICSYGSVPLDSLTANIDTRDNSGGNKHLIWDEANEMILAATGARYYIHQVGFNLSINDPELRVFSSIGDDGRLLPQHISLRTTSPKQLIGDPNQHAYRAWTHKRIYKDEETRLEQLRHFVQYRPDQSKPSETRDKAISDIRFLVNQYGKDGVWLWDPFLSARDLLDTLFHCSHSGVPMRALTDGLEPRECVSSKDSGGLDGSVKKFINEQRDALNLAAGNLRKLSLEYRIRIGQAGFKFHDRFLIFPRIEEPPLAWSLGTSVNGVGKAHHILQRVDNGRLIMDAFAELWDQLAGTCYLIWKTP